MTNEANCNMIVKTKVKHYDYIGRHGTSTVRTDCPFCNEKRILCYVWSLHGSGKKCPSCGALLTWGFAFK